MTSSYDAAAAGYDEAHGDRRSQIRFARIEAPMLAACRHARAVLEIGVGTGRLLSKVRAPMRVGVDVSAEMLRWATTRGGLALVRADAHHLPFADASFDAVLAGKGAFRYLDPPRGFAECARVLRPGGRLALHQYAADTWTWRRLLGRDVPDPAVRRMHVERVDDLEQLARDAGLVPELARLFRAVRIFPYVARVPRRAAGRLWSHVVLVCRRPWGCP
jgi:ubiquinone/menaquinone biosynthesis C-methylase UbiE